MDTITSPRHGQDYSKRQGTRHTCFPDAVLRHLKIPGRRALDLGAGEMLNDARYLIEKGFWGVTAVDITDPLPERKHPLIACSRSRLEDYVPQSAAFDACIASNSLYFCPKARLPNVFDRVHEGLRTGGIFTGNILTSQDPWVKLGPEHRSWVTSADMEILCAGFEVILSEETTKLREDYPEVQKDWHTRIFILRKI
jgi:hypothetical protein